MADSSKGASMAQLESVLDEYLVKKAPFTLPSNVKELIVKFAPWLTLIGVAISVPAVLTLLGMGSAFSAMRWGYGYGMYRVGMMYNISMVFLAISVVLNVLALPGLFARKKAGWNFVYYGVLVSAVQSLISFNLGSLIIGTLIGLYFLFQVKSLYK